MKITEYDWEEGSELRRFFWGETLLVAQKIIFLVARIAPQLPTGIVDIQAYKKLCAEQEELYVALSEGDIVGALTEVADVGYYIGKAYLNGLLCQQNAIGSLESTVDAFKKYGYEPILVADVPYLTRAKYESRIVLGKNDAAERAACLEALNRK